MALARLVDNCRKSGSRSLAVVGLVKNVGKTTVVNAVAQRLTQGLTLGLVSAGRDGEPIDMLTELPKPRIMVSKGSLVATVARALDVATARFSLVRHLSATAAMGPLVVARCEQPGRVELIGPPGASDLADVIAALFQEGAEFVICDGAFDRRASAAPSVTDSLILATGAALSFDMDLVVKKTWLATELYRLRPVHQLLPTGASDNLPVNVGVAVLGHDGKWQTLAVPSALGFAGEVTAMARGAVAVYVGGALVTSALEALAREGGVRRVIVRDATRIFLDWTSYSRYRKAGGVLGVVNPANLIAVTVNPWSPAGPGFEADSFLAATARAVAPLPTVNVVSGAHCQFRNINQW